MAVIIDGIDVPKSCRRCRLFRDDCCIISDKRTWGYSVHDEKPKDCPIRDMNEVLFSIYEDVSKLSWWQGRQKICNIEVVWAVLNAKVRSESDIIQSDMVSKRAEDCQIHESKTRKGIHNVQVTSCTNGDTYSEEHYECSLCNSIYKHNFNFCPYCGAEMEKEM